MMRLKYTLSVAALAIAATASAQVGQWRSDTLATGVGYAEDAYFSLENGQVAAVANNNWDLAFPGGVGSMMRHTVITNNYGNGLSGKLLDLGVTSTAFGTDLTADTAGLTAITNMPETWEEGAFGVAMGGTNPAWGEYNTTTHYIDGDKVYAYINANGAYQIWLEQFQASATPANRKWIFHVANLDGTDTATIEFQPIPDYANKHLAYFSLQSRTWVNRDPDYGTWDLLATKYGDSGYMGPAIMSTTGILTSPTVQVAVASPVIPDDADYADYENAYSENRNEIGGKFKYLNEAYEWTLEDSLSYFIKNVYGEDSGTIWQAYFDYFPTATSGVDVKIGIQIRKVYEPPVVSVNNISSAINNIVIAPNPTEGHIANILVDAKKDLNNTRIMITDISGRVVMTTVKDIDAGFRQLRLDVSHFAPGMYMVNLSGEGWSNSQKLIVR